MAINQLMIGRACFIVRAESLPNGYNQRPGMTLLLADGEPLALEFDDQSIATADAWLLAPEIPRRFGINHVALAIRDGNLVMNRSRTKARSV